MSVDFHVSYSKYVLNAAEKNIIDKKIVKAVETSPQIKKEMDRVFQVANRRIQNLEKSGTPSPALMSLGDMGDRYTKFTRSGKSFTQQKMEYFKALNFLNQPTSTSTGAKQFNAHLKQTAGVPDDLWGYIQPKVIDGYTKFESGLMGAMTYEQVIKNYYTHVKNTITQEMQNTANQGENSYNNLIKNLQNQAYREIERGLNDIIKGMTDSFRNMGR